MSTSFVSSWFVISYWIIFIIPTLKSFSDNSNVWLILVLASVDCVFIHTLIMEGKWYHTWILLYSGHLVYYARRLRILFKSSVLAVSHPTEFSMEVLILGGCGSSVNSVFREPAMSFWSALFAWCPWSTISVFTVGKGCIFLPWSCLAPVVVGWKMWIGRWEHSFGFHLCWCCPQGCRALPWVCSFMQRCKHFFGVVLLLQVAQGARQVLT